VRDELVLRAQGGDRDAYEALARSVAPELYRVAYRILRNVELAQDAVQHALVAIWRDLPQLRDADRFSAWTYRAVVRAAYNVIRSERGALSRFRVIATADVGGPDSTVSVAERHALEQAFRRLTPEHRAIVVLRHYVGLSIEEAADALGIPPGTARSRLHYAIRALRAALEADERPSERSYPA
jgi:RNA polymerase sigma-70 factor (ECF subfamily)